MRCLLRTGVQLGGPPLSPQEGRKGKDNSCRDSRRLRARPAISRIPGLLQ
jgi:hypothetical protein